MYKIGKKFGLLTIVSKRIIKNHRGFYNCLCDCGKMHIVRSDTLNRGKNGAIISCGCYRGKREKGLASFNMCYKTYKERANLKNLSFKLDKNTFKNLITQNCYYCNSLPSNRSGHHQNNGYFMYNGLDRINNNIGYELNNLLSCCKRCNIAKNNQDLKTFIEWIKKLYNNINKIEDLK